MLLLSVGFVVYAVQPYITLDPSRARLAPLPDNPMFYPLLITHIFLGSVVLLTGCLQLWPWLRRTHPGVHRWSGRVYVVALLAAALAVIVIAPLTRFGPNQRSPTPRSACSGCSSRFSATAPYDSVGSPIIGSG